MTHPDLSEANAVPADSENRKREAFLRSVTPTFVLPSDVVRRRLREYRELRDLSQPALAKMMSAAGQRLSGKQICEIEAGKRKVTVDELFVFAHVLDIPLLLLVTPDNRHQHVRISDWLGLSGVECRNWLVFGDPMGENARGAQAMMRSTFELAFWMAVLVGESTDAEKAEAQAEIRTALQTLEAVAGPPSAAKQLRARKRDATKQDLPRVA